MEVPIMALPQHVDEAANRLKGATARIEDARGRAVSLESLREWLSALTDFTQALSDVNAFNNESVHEKLHAFADRMGLREFPTSRGKTGA